MRGVVPLALLTALAPWPEAARAAPPPDHAPPGEAALLASVCSGCHGGGHSSAIKSLEGRSAADLTQELLRYKTAADGASAMHRMARGYSDEQIRLIAAHIAGR